MEWIAGIAVAIIILVIFLYNKLVKLRNRYKNAFAQIDVQLSRRYDLIPNLVEIAKKYMQHERETLEAVIQARNTAVNGLRQASANPDDAAAMTQLAAAEQGLSGMLGRLFALSESYPDLKANQNMMQLSEELSSTENRVAFARQGYNDAVMAYNVSSQQFPANLIAGRFGFHTATLLEIDDPVKREAPRVAF